MLLRRDDKVANSNGQGQPPKANSAHAHSSSKRSNWRQQVVRDQLGHTSHTGSQSRSISPPVRLPMTSQPRLAPLRLRFIIVGGSIGGLAAAFALARAGHHVQVLEKKSSLVKNACGIRIPPNLARILERWGVGKEFKDKAILCNKLTFRKLHTGEILGHLEYKEEVMKVLEADFWLMHYSDLLELLYSLAISVGAVIKFGSEVTSIDENTPSVTVSTGEVFTADLIIGADGYHSICQQLIENALVEDGEEMHERVDSGTVVYSMNANVSDITPESDPELYELVHRPEWTAYAGPYVSVLTSPSRNYNEFSVQIFNPDVPGTSDTWDRVVPVETIDTTNFPRVLLELSRRSKSAVETKFVKRKIEDWIHPNSKIVLLGESAHPQIPSSTHSGSLAVEDAAVLGAIFSRLRTHDQIPNFLQGYEELRMERCWEIQKSESDNSSSVMLPDGPEQEERDRSMREAAKLESGGWDEAMFRHLWENIRILFAYDPEEDAEEWWQRWGILREHAESGFGLDKLTVETADFGDEEDKAESYIGNRYTRFGSLFNIYDSDDDFSMARNHFSLTRAVTFIVESSQC